MFGLSSALAEVRSSQGAIVLSRSEPPETPPWSDAAKHIRSGTRSPTRRLRVRLNPAPPKTARIGKNHSSPTTWQHAPADSPTYRKLPIDIHTGRHTEIRLLRILPGSDVQPVSCELIHTTLSNPLEFDALSYCWGAATPRVEAHCDGRRISIAPNLSSALRALRHETSPRMLWVDAICINQVDLDEKKIQVPLMGQVYSKAAAVQIWLGDDTPERTCATAFSILRSLARLCSRFGWDTDFEYLIRHRMFNDYDLPDVMDESWDAIRHLAEMSWFSRTWIIQEVVLARQSYIHCGEASLPWLDFCIGWLSLGRIIPGHRPDIVPSVSSYAQVMQLILSYHKMGDSSIQPELLSLLENHRNSRATDPSDKVYGFLGLCEQKGTQIHGFVPDYRRTVSETFFDAAKTIIEHDQILHILGVPREDYQSRMDGLPSWVPDWSTYVFASSLSSRTVDGAYLYSFDAAKVHEVPKHAAVHGKSLELSGRCFDEVVAVGCVADPYFKKDKGSDHLRLIVSASIFHLIALGLDWLLLSGGASGRRYPNGQSAFDAFVRTIYLDDFSGRYSAEEVTEYYRRLYMPFYVLSKDSKIRSPWLSTMNKISSLQLSILCSLLGPALLRKLARVVGKIEKYRPAHVCWKLQQSPPEIREKGLSTQIIIDAVHRSIYRRMFRTKSGYIGLGPRLTQKGDHIFLVRGSRVPLVLRSQDSERWTLLGDCYVHGIMHGEAFDETTCQTLLVV